MLTSCIAFTAVSLWDEMNIVMLYSQRFLNPCMWLRAVVSIGEGFTDLIWAGICSEAGDRCRWSSKFDGLAVHFAWKSWGMISCPVSFYSHNVSSESHLCIPCEMPLIPWRVVFCLSTMHVSCCRLLSIVCQSIRDCRCYVKRLLLASALVTFRPSERFLDYCF